MGLLSAGDLYVTPAEELVYRFRTQSGKVCAIAMEKSGAYLVYRYGTEDNVELQFPESLEKSWDLFTYEWEARGAANLGFTYDSVIFINKGYEYTVYYCDYFSDEEISTCIEIKSPEGKLIRIEGLPSSVQGDITQLKKGKYPLRVVKPDY